VSAASRRRRWLLKQAVLDPSLAPSREDFDRLQLELAQPNGQAQQVVDFEELNEAVRQRWPEWHEFVDIQADQNALQEFRRLHPELDDRYIAELFGGPAVPSGSSVPSHEPL